MKRRSFLLGLASALAAPAVVRAGVLMPVRSLIVPDDFDTAKMIVRMHEVWINRQGYWFTVSSGGLLRSAAEDPTRWSTA